MRFNCSRDPGLLGCHRGRAEPGHDRKEAGQGVEGSAGNRVAVEKGVANGAVLEEDGDGQFSSN